MYVYPCICVFRELVRPCICVFVYLYIRVFVYFALVEECVRVLVDERVGTQTDSKSERQTMNGSM